MAVDERWGVWITQGKPCKGCVTPSSYWWQGPTYKGPPDLTESEARTMAETLQTMCPLWRYEAKIYLETER